MHARGLLATRRSAIRSTRGNGARVDSHAHHGVSVACVTAREPSLQEALDLARLGADRAADRLGLGGVGRVVRRGWRAMRPLAPHLAAVVLLSLLTIACLVGVGLWLGFRVVWDLVGQGSPPAAWELALLGIAQAPEGPALRQAIASAAAPRLVLLTIVGAVAALSLRYYGIWILQRVNQLLRLAFFERAQALSLRFHADARVGDLLYRLSQDSAGVTQILDTAVIQPLVALGTFTIGFGALALLAPPYALTPPLAAVLVLLIGRLASKPLRARFRRAREAQSDLTSSIQEAAAGIRAVKAYGNEDRALHRFEEASRHAFRRALAARGLFAVYRTAVFLVIGTALLAVTLSATGRAQAAPPLAWPLFGMTVFGLAAYNAARTLSGMALDAIQGVATLWGRAQDMVIGLDRVFETLDRVPEVRDAPGVTPLPAFSRTVELRGVSFAYAAGQPALRDVSLVARAGEMLAVLGPTGAGKSTLLALVARFFDPDAGVVLVDGHDLRQATVRSVRDQTAIALQEHVLFAATVRENLLYGRPGASDPDLRAAAAVACADEFVRALPRGYDTLLGERGAKLSTGQRQQIGIARAVLKGAPILLLDEPTASLDAETELRVLDNLRAWSMGRCVFLVTHRLSAARRADRVVFLEQGRVVEEGRHEELLARPAGRYRAFVDAQRAPLADDRGASSGAAAGARGDGAP
jgi:ABC-type multidrug transport system fused ATPase/permease subunit